MAILITGGCGYIGSHTCIELCKAGYEVVALDNFHNAKPKVIERISALSGKPLTFYTCDIRDARGLSAIFEAHTVEAVIHFAGWKAVGESTVLPLEYYENNVSGTVTLLKVMRKFGCKRIVFSSSATVYGEENPSPLTEDMPVGKVANPYARTKLFNEHVIEDVCAADPDFCGMLLRYFNPIGAHESGTIGEDPNGIPNNLMPYIAQVAVGKLPYLQVFGNDYPTHDGTGIRDYIHVVDLARGHVAAVAYALSHTGAQVVNLGTGVGYSVLDVVTAFERVNQIPIPYKIVPRREGDVTIYLADPTKAKELLGWQAEHSLEDMCRDTWRWQQRNPNGYDDE
ncbi:MAG: UDP-glucose 4-epimerase GalE [Clostridia bacterium]|nr:UDP-glucose 4-epimerase GalE [Clostridia bacterium]